MARFRLSPSSTAQKLVVTGCVIGAALLGVVVYAFVHGEKQHIAAALGFLFFYGVGIAGTLGYQYATRCPITATAGPWRLSILVEGGELPAADATTLLSMATRVLRARIDDQPAMELIQVVPPAPAPVPVPVPVPAPAPTAAAPVAAPAPAQMPVSAPPVMPGSATTLPAVQPRLRPITEVTRTWCDRCLEEQDARIDASRKLQVGDKLLDLCEEHYVRLEKETKKQPAALVS